MIDDVRLCFICQAETGTCDHIEPELRSLVAQRRRVAGMLSLREAREVREMARRGYRDYHVLVKERTDPPKLARGRMPWPSTGVQPEDALASRRRAV